MCIACAVLLYNGQGRVCSPQQCPKYVSSTLHYDIAMQQQFLSSIITLQKTCQINNLPLTEVLPQHKTAHTFASYAVYMNTLYLKHIWPQLALKSLLMSADGFLSKAWGSHAVGLSLNKVTGFYLL